jgi:quinol monooxygenase YgiN
MTPLVYVDRARVREGALGQLKAAIAELAEYVEQREPRLISYSVYFTEDESEMTVVHVHADAASLDHHMDVLEARLERFSDLVKLSSIDIYGEPSARALAQLRDKIRLLGTGAVTVHSSHAGFSRPGS